MYIVGKDDANVVVVVNDAKDNVGDNGKVSDVTMKRWEVVGFGFISDFELIACSG